MNSISLQGGLGNVLFQVSALIGYSLKYDRPYCIPTKSINPHKSEPELPIFPGVNYCTGKVDGEILVHNELSFEYNEIPKYDFENTLLLGYYQSFKYLEGYRKEILKAFGFDDIITIPDTCSIHIRLGDYKQYPKHHPIISKTYLFNAINEMWLRSRCKHFIVFSDDIEEAKDGINELQPPHDYLFEYSEGKSGLEDLIRMASCENNITANSTLSLWGAYINPNPQKIIISPKKWFGDSVNHNTSDLYIPNSIIL